MSFYIYNGGLKNKFMSLQTVYFIIVTIVFTLILFGIVVLSRFFYKSVKERKSLKLTTPITSDVLPKYENEKLMEELKEAGFDKQKLDAIYKFTNDQSHMTGSGFDPALVPETKKVIGELFDMIADIAPNHFKIIDKATSWQKLGMIYFFYSISFYL